MHTVDTAMALGQYFPFWPWWSVSKRAVRGYMLLTLCSTKIMHIEYSMSDISPVKGGVTIRDRASVS